MRINAKHAVVRIKKKMHNLSTHYTLGTAGLPRRQNMSQGKRPASFGGSPAGGGSPAKFGKGSTPPSDSLVNVTIKGTGKLRLVKYSFQFSGYKNPNQAALVSLQGDLLGDGYGSIMERTLYVGADLSRRNIALTEGHSNYTADGVPPPPVA
jgi:hypothetical protein